MNDQAYLNEQLTHHLIRERVARASEPHIHTGAGATGSPSACTAGRPHREVSPPTTP